MNWRAIGCLGVGIVAFVGIGLLGLNLATSRVGCPERLAWGEEAWEASGPATGEPQIGTGGDQPVEIGATLIGLTSRRVYGPAGSAPVTGANENLPAQLALECGDGTFQGYQAVLSRGSPPSG